MKTLLLALLIIPLAYSQQLQPVSSLQADCGKFTQPAITTAGTFTTQNIDNRFAGCDGFVVTYSSNGFATVSVLLQSAPLGVNGIAGTFVSFAGSIISPFTNPTTATTQGETRATGYFPYIRVQITTTGTGYLAAELHGFKTNPNSGSGASTTACGTSATPCVVDGPTAAGFIPTKPPVQMGGQDQVSGVVTNIQTDSNGGTLLGYSGVSPQPDGTISASLGMVGIPSPAGFDASIQTVPFFFDGTNWNRARGGSGSNNLGTTTTTQGVAQVMEMMADPTGAAGSVVQMGSVNGVGDGATARNALQTGSVLFNGTNYDRARGSAAHGALVQPTGNDAVLSGQQAVTNAAVALATNGSKNICVKSLAGNMANVYIGPTGITTATGMELAPGDAYCGPVSNTNLLFVIAAAGGSSVSWIATN